MKFICPNCGVDSVSAKQKLFLNARFPSLCPNCHAKLKTTLKTNAIAMVPYLALLGWTFYAEPRALEFATMVVCASVIATILQLFVTPITVDHG